MLPVRRPTAVRQATGCAAQRYSAGSRLPGLDAGLVDHYAAQALFSCDETKTAIHATIGRNFGNVGDSPGSTGIRLLGAANREPRRRADPDAFDLSRNPSGHVGFSMGMHQCVGRHVARLEYEALLTALVAQVKA